MFIRRRMEMAILAAIIPVEINILAGIVPIRRSRRKTRQKIINRQQVKINRQSERINHQQVKEQINLKILSRIQGKQISHQQMKEQINLWIPSQAEGRTIQDNKLFWRPDIFRPLVYISPCF